MHPRLSNRYDWDSLGDIVKKRLQYEKTGHDYAHIMRVLENALKIAEPYKKIDYDVLVAASLLHDISLEKSPIKNHQITSAAEAIKILKKMKFSSDTIKKVEYVILCHNKNFSKIKISEKLTLEAQILCDADLLDAIGSIGLIRMINFSLHQKIPYFISKNDALDQSYYGNIKYMIKIGQNMHTPQAKLLTWQRLALMRIFLRELESESVSKR